jgi:PhnB protein
MDGIKPYISFKGNCQEAMKFYQEKLGAELIFSQTWGESPMAEHAPGNGDKIMHCSIKIGDSVIMACDNVCGEGENATTIGNNISLALGTKDVADAERRFEAMSDGAKIVMPMQETFWAERFGMLTDKFGISWMFNCDKPHDEQAKASA